MNRSALTIGLILFGIAAVVAYLTLFTVDLSIPARSRGRSFWLVP
jgi:hypothetical protein